MERVLCFNAEFSLLFSPYTSHSAERCSRAENIFLSPLNDIFHHKSAKEASISIHISSWSYMELIYNSQLFCFLCMRVKS